MLSTLFSHCTLDGKLYSFTAALFLLSDCMLCLSCIYFYLSVPASFLLLQICLVYCSLFVAEVFRVSHTHFCSGFRFKHCSIRPEVSFPVVPKKIADVRKCRAPQASAYRSLDCVGTPASRLNGSNQIYLPALSVRICAPGRTVSMRRRGRYGNVDSPRVIFLLQIMLRF